MIDYFTGEVIDNQKWVKVDDDVYLHVETYDKYCKFLRKGIPTKQDLDLAHDFFKEEEIFLNKYLCVMRKFAKIQEQNPRAIMGQFKAKEHMLSLQMYDSYYDALSLQNKHNIRQMTLDLMLKLCGQNEQELDKIKVNKDFLAWVVEFKEMYLKKPYFKPNDFIYEWELKKEISAVKETMEISI